MRPARSTLIIVEDHPLVGQGLRVLLQPYHDVADVVQDPRQVAESLRRHRPKLMLLDLAMADTNGLELLPEVFRIAPDVKVLVVTMHVDRAFAEASFRRGAHGFIPKEAPVDELREAITVVLSGERYLSPRVARRAHRSARIPRDPALYRLTPRQREILALTGRGRTATEISAQLGVSPRTVEFHRMNIRRVLGIHAEWGLIEYAILSGLVPGSAPEPG